MTVSACATCRFFGSQQRKELATDAAVVTDGSGYAARLRVLPTFGCTLHEPKEMP